MRGLMTRQADGTLSAELRCKWGYIYALTGTKTDAGYEVEVNLVGIPESLAVPGDELDLEVVK